MMAKERHLVFASHNLNKIQEVNDILGLGFRILGLDEIGCHEEIPEPYDTLEENALAKARHVFSHYGKNCFADDTGLEVDVLKGQPGVLSARYAGPEKDNRANVNKLLKELTGKINRKARFRTVIALVIDGKEYFFEGIVNGMITMEAKGSKGFGYDPVFIPDGYDQTFGELDAAIKNRISHRWAAVAKLADFLMFSSFEPPLRSAR
jgi:XTP/dITP diphosphohydrolase